MLSDTSAFKLFPAPMAGLGDRAFRELCNLCGGAEPAWIPMIGAKAISHPGSRKHTFGLLDWGEEEERHVQIFGSSPAELAEAVHIMADFGLKSVNINMGCCMPKVTKGGGGCAVLQDPDLASRMIEACAEAAGTETAVSVKMRLGWKTFNTGPLLERMAELGVSAVFVHGRLGTDSFEAPLRMEELRRAASSASVPFYANGSITQETDLRKFIRMEGCHGVMIGRASLGHPDIFNVMRRRLDGVPAGENSFSRPLIQAVLALRHTELAGKFYRGEEKEAVKKLRRHLSRYEVLGTEALKLERFSELERFISGRIAQLQAP